MTLTGLSIHRPIGTAMFFIGLGLLGMISLSRLPVQLFPELIYPEVFVVASLPGASPEQIERELMMPLEEEIGKLDGVQMFESSARANGGGIRISYAPDTDMKFAFLQLQSRLARVQPTLPEQSRVDAQRFDASDLSATVMQLHVLGEGDLNWLREFAEQKIRPELEAIDGVVSAQALGGRRQAIEVIADPLMMQAHNLTLSQIRTRLNAHNLRRQYLGRVYDGSQALSVSLEGQFRDLNHIRNAVIRPDISLRLGDIATVRYGLQEQVDQQRINGRQAVGIRIQKDDEANLIEVARAVGREIVRLNRDFSEENIELVISTSQADMMEEALKTLKQAALAGALLGLFVLFVFLRNLRFVAVLLLAIPISLLVTFNLMYAFDLSLNVLTLCGLALAVGMLTDNGIVVMENIFKYHELGKPPLEAARLGAEEVSRAVIAATATTVAVFLPLVFIQSDAQSILRELALSMTFPLLASLLVALTLVPTLAARTLVRSIRPRGNTGPLMEKYTVLLKAGLRHRIGVSLGIAGALVMTMILAFFFMLQRDARQEETRFTIYVSLPEGTTIEATDAVVRDVENAVHEAEGLDRFITSIRENQASVEVLLKKLSQRPNAISVERIKEKLDESFAEIQGAVIGYQPRTRAGQGGGGAGMRRPSSGGFNLTGGQSAEEIVIRGYDFTVLQMLADDLVYRLEALEDIMAANSVQADAQRSAPEVHVIPDEVALFDRRLSAQNVLSSVNDARPDGFQTSVPFLTPEEMEVPIFVRTVEDPQKTEYGLSDFRRTPIAAPGGGFAGLEEVAHVRTDEGRAMIARTNQSRRTVVSYRFNSDVMNAQPMLEEARATVRSVVQDMVLPAGYTLEMIEGKTEVIYYWMMGIAAVLIFMILASLFESFSAPFVILGTLPTAVIGSCWALLLSGTGLTQQEGPMALLGFIVLLGIAVNNGIVLIDAMHTLRFRRGFRIERAVLVAARARVRPILMTSATTLLGVLPLAFTFGGDYEIWPPFAITVLGGLTVSMISTLIFIPVVYLGMDQLKAWLKDIGWLGIGIATAAAAGIVLAIDGHYQSLFWTSLSALPAWFSCLACLWAGKRLYQTRTVVQQKHGPVITLQLRNLTKIYGAPGKFRQEWNRFNRRHVRMAERGLDPIDRKAIFDSLIWKVPLLGLFLFLDAYFDDPIYVYVAALGTWGIADHLLRCMGMLLRLNLDGRWGRLLFRWMLPLFLVGYIHWRLNLLSVTLSSALFYLAIVVMRVLADRVRSGKVDPEQMAGRTALMRRLIYQGASAMPVIGVSKPEFSALSGVDMDIGKGMFGLLGPNGAGKTTLMRILCRVLQPTRGSVQVNGRNFQTLRGLIGYLPQRFGLYEHMTAFDYLEYRALLEGFKDGASRRDRVAECLDLVNLYGRKDDRIGSFSGGMKQRVGIAQTLLHLPQIIVVDEPTAGLDPLERIRFRNLLARFSQDRVVIFSTHIVEDIAGSCNRLAVLNRGRVIYAGTPEEMRTLAQGRVWEAVVDDRGLDKLQKERDVISHVRGPDGIRLRFLSGEPVSEAEPAAPSLEDAYLFLLRYGGRAC